MPFSDAIVSHLPNLALVVARLAGLFVLAPLVSSAVVPARFRALIALSLALAIYPTIDHAQMIPRSLGLYDLLPLLAGELLLGASIGLVAALPLIGAQMGGLIAGQQMGLGLASVLNPAIDIEGDSVSQFLFFLAMGLYLAAGGVELLFGALLGTFATLPAGGLSLGSPPLEVLTGVLQSGTELALRVALPLLAVLFLETIAAGFISRSVPSLNFMAYGFPLRIMLGLLVVVSALLSLGDVIEAEVGSVLDGIGAWLSESPVPDGA